MWVLGIGGTSSVLLDVTEMDGIRIRRPDPRPHRNPAISGSAPDPEEKNGQTFTLDLETVPRLILCPLPTQPGAALLGRLSGQRRARVPRPRPPGRECSGRPAPSPGERVTAFAPIWYAKNTKKDNSVGLRIFQLWVHVLGYEGTLKPIAKFEPIEA